MTAGVVNRTTLTTGTSQDTGPPTAPSRAKTGAKVFLLASTAEQLNDPTGPIEASLRHDEVRMMAAAGIDHTHHAIVFVEMLSDDPIPDWINKVSPVHGIIWRSPSRRPASSKTGPSCIGLLLALEQPTRHRCLVVKHSTGIFERTGKTSWGRWSRSTEMACYCE